MMPPTEQELRVYAAVAMLDEGTPRKEVCRDYGISSATLDRWMGAVRWWMTYTPGIPAEEWKARRYGNDQ